MNIFITGTDTDVGKTYVTTLLITALRERGIDAVGFKPISCGDNQDAQLLAAASGGLPVEEVCPLTYQSSLAPQVANMLENKPADIEAILTAYHTLAARHQLVLVEGIGGWEVPITDTLRVSGFAKTLGLPVLLVVGNKLGAINHTLLTADSIRNHGLRCLGLILNQLDDELDTAMVTNKAVLPQLTGLPLLDHLIHGQDFIANEAIDAILNA